MRQVKYVSDISAIDSRMQARSGFVHSFSSLAELDAALMADSDRVKYPVDSQVSYRMLQICVYGESS